MNKEAIRREFGRMEAYISQKMLYNTWKHSSSWCLTQIRHFIYRPNENPSKPLWFPKILEVTISYVQATYRSL